MVSMVSCSLGEQYLRTAARSALRLSVPSGMEQMDNVFSFFEKMLLKKRDRPVAP